MRDASETRSPPRPPHVASHGLSRDALICRLTHLPSLGSSDGLCVLLDSFPARHAVALVSGTGATVWSGLCQPERFPDPGSLIGLLCQVRSSPCVFFWPSGTCLSDRPRMEAAIGCKGLLDAGTQVSCCFHAEGKVQGEPARKEKEPKQTW
jgi:hypothetical protein